MKATLKCLCLLVTATVTLLAQSFVDSVAKQPTLRGLHKRDCDHLEHLATPKRPRALGSAQNGKRFAGRAGSGNDAAGMRFVVLDKGKKVVGYVGPFKNGPEAEKWGERAMRLGGGAVTGLDVLTLSDPDHVTEPNR